MNTVSMCQRVGALSLLALASLAHSQEERVKQLDKIQVEASEEPGAYSSNATIGGKTARDPRELQQSVSVITQQRIQDQSLTTANEALEQVTGVTVVDIGVQGSQSIYARGFEVNNLQFDGGAPTVFNQYWSFGLPDLAAYEQVEVLRGADGLFSGAGEPGGTINLVRKRPLSHTQIKVDALAGSWSRYRGELDVTGALAWDGRLRGRFVAAHEDRDYFYDVAKDKKTVLYGILETSLTERTVLAVGVNYEKSDSVPNGIGLPRYSTGADMNLPRSTCLCMSWSFWDSTSKEVFATLDQSFNDAWSLKLNLSRRNVDTDARYAYTIGAVNPFDSTGPFLDGRTHHLPNRQTLLDASLNGRFELLGMPHELTLGASWQDVNADGSRYFFPIRDDIPVDVIHFNPNAFTDPGESAFPDIVFTKTGQEQFGVYAALRSRPTERLHTVLGLRYSNYRSNDVFDRYMFDTGVQTLHLDSSFEESDVLTPYGGLTFVLNDTLSAYGSFSRIFKPQAKLLTASMSPLKPIDGDSYEIGLKGAWLDGTVNAAVAAYQVRRRNEGVLSFESETIPNCCYIPAAEIQSRGFDAELTGQLLPNWQLFTGYTFNSNKFEAGHGEDDGTVYRTVTPKHLLRLWTMVRLPGGFADWRLGGGIDAQSRTYASGRATTYSSSGTPTGSVPYDVTQEAYATLGLRGEYRITEKWTAAINVKNLLDKTYYQTLLTDIRCCQYYGEPRNVTLSVRGSF